MAAPKRSNPVTELFSSDPIEAEETVELGGQSIFPEREEEGLSEGLGEALRRKVDGETLAEREASLLLPRGVYKWVGECSVKPKFQEEDKGRQDLAPGKGRLLVSVSGPVVNVETQKKGRFNFSYSPDARTTEDGGLDFFSQNHVRLAMFYLKKFARRHESEQELISFLQGGKYSMYITLSTSGRNNLQELRA